MDGMLGWLGGRALRPDGVLAPHERNEEECGERDGVAGDEQHDRIST
jgi:hypothetical protein